MLVCRVGGCGGRDQVDLGWADWFGDWIEVEWCLVDLVLCNIVLSLLQILLYGEGI